MRLAGGRRHPPKEIPLAAAVMIATRLLKRIVFSSSLVASRKLGSRLRVLPRYEIPCFPGFSFRYIKAGLAKELDHMIAEFANRIFSWRG